MGSRYTTSGSRELALPDQLSCMAKAGNAVLARMQAHARHGGSEHRIARRSIQGILEKRRDHAILFIQIDGKARGRQQQRILAKACRGINRPWALDTFCARSLYQQLFAANGPALSRGCMRVKSARSSIVPSVSVSPSDFWSAQAPRPEQQKRGSTTPMSTP